MNGVVVNLTSRMAGRERRWTSLWRVKKWDEIGLRTSSADCQYVNAGYYYKP